MGLSGTVQLSRGVGAEALIGPPRLPPRLTGPEGEQAPRAPQLRWPACWSCSTPPGEPWCPSRPVSRARCRCTCAVPRSTGRRTSATAASRWSFDVLRRYLVWTGLDVTYVSNITDIDDKIIAPGPGARRGHLAEVVAENEAIWWDAMEAIGVARPDHDPHATDYVEQMVDLIADLIDAGRGLRVRRRRLLLAAPSSATTACWPVSRSSRCRPAPVSTSPSTSTRPSTSPCGSWPSPASRPGPRPGATGARAGTPSAS